MSRSAARRSKNCEFSNFLQFLEKSQKLQKSQFLLGTLVPPVTLDLISFSKNCDFSNFSQFLEKSQKLQKSQFLLDTLVPPVTLEFSSFSKNCDFSNFSQFLQLRANLDIFAHIFHAGRKITRDGSVPTALFEKCIRGSSQRCVSLVLLFPSLMR